MHPALMSAISHTQLLRVKVEEKVNLKEIPVIVDVIRRVHPPNSVNSRHIGNSGASVRCAIGLGLWTPKMAVSIWDSRGREKRGCVLHRGTAAESLATE